MLDLVNIIRSWIVMASDRRNNHDGSNAPLDFRFFIPRGLTILIKAVIDVPMMLTSKNQ